MSIFSPEPGAASAEQLASEIKTISDAPLMTGLLDSISGMLAVLDEHRQLVAVNDTLMKVLGVEDAKETLGLRLGEAMHCIHADKEPAGCGTTKYCSSCGAAIAMVVSLTSETPCEKMCALKVEQNGVSKDLALLVKTHPMVIDGKRFLILFLQDVTEHQKRAIFERTFLHDINNLIAGLVGASQLLATTDLSVQMAEQVYKTSVRLANEVKIQQYLASSDDVFYKARYETVTVAAVYDELVSFLENHPRKKGKEIQYSNEAVGDELTTDLSLLTRILLNMVLNALEASEKEGLVKVWTDQIKGRIRFNVWNEGKIPEDVARRIFQRNFSTKSQEGRGVGTYSMKLFGERILDGKVSFTTSENGTVFSFTV